MINLEFTQQQVAELKIYYNSELNKIQKRADEIREIIEKFNEQSKIQIRKTDKFEVQNSIPKTDEINFESIDKSMINKKQKNELTSTMLKTTTKLIEIRQDVEKQNDKLPKTITYNWSIFIIEILEKNQRFILAREFLQLAMEQYQVLENEKEKFRIKIASVLSKLEKEKVLKTIKKEGVTSNYYGLSGWIKENGEIIQKYVTPVKQNEIINKVGNIRPIWSAFILSTLKEQNKILQAKNIVALAMSKYNILKNKKEQTRSYITSNISTLQNSRQLIKSLLIEGYPAQYYGLSEWFDQNGELKSIFCIEAKSLNRNYDNPKRKKKGTSIWPAFIIDTLKEQNKILQVKDLVDLAKFKYKISSDQFIKLRNLLSINISNLEYVKGILKPIKIIGERSNYYGLTEWFNENGKIKIEYAKIDE